MNKAAIVTVLLALSTAACENNSHAGDSRTVERQQRQYGIAQPVPLFDWSLERHLLIELYKVRNKSVATHSVWRSMTGIIEGDCASLGYGLPYDISLTNPLVIERLSMTTGLVVEQAEPNGVFASKNTSATWVMCVGDGGNLEPIYIETKVTVYPYTVNVNYETNRVTKSGKASFTIPKK